MSEKIARLDKSVIDMVYPVGAIYMSVNSTNPGNLFGGKWEQIKDRFLLSAGDTYTAGSTGGEAQHTLTKDEMPSHRHNSDSYQDGFAQSSVQTDKYITWVNRIIESPRFNYPETGENGPVTTSSVGGSQPHNNMPPYLSVYIWKRTA